MAHAPLLRRKRRLAAKIEGTPGTAVTIGNADGVFIVYDPEYTPEIDFNQRPLAGTFSQLAGVPGARGASLRFACEVLPDAANGAVTISVPKMQIVGLPPGDRNGIDIKTVSFQAAVTASGNTEASIAFAGTPPAWAATFLPACGWVAAGNTFTPRAEAPGTNVKTLTMAHYVDGLLERMAGAAGTFVIRMTAAQVVLAEFNFMGIDMDPADVSMVGPTFPTTNPKRFQGATVTTVNGSVTWSPVLNEITLDAGNNVVLRPDATKSGSIFHAMSTSHRIVGTMNPETPLVATKALHREWINREVQALTIVLP